MSDKIISTKQLACELGLLRKRAFSVSQSNEKKKHKSVEFPAILINCCSGEIESEFHYYVQPSENPILSEFCQQLTGISQNLVDDGIPLSQCLRKFLFWLKKLQREKGIVCADDKNSSVFKNGGTQNNVKVAAFVTWSDWDLGVCLLYETKRKQIMKPSVLDRWIDLRATYRKFYSRRPDGLSGALKDLGINFDGRQHSGLDDAKNTAKLAYRMICDGCILNITKTLKMGLLSSTERISYPHPTMACSSSTNSIHLDSKLDARGDKACTDNTKHLKDTSRSSDKISPLIHSKSFKLSERNPNLPLSSKKTEKCSSPGQSHKKSPSLVTAGKNSISSPALRSPSSRKQSHIILGKTLPIPESSHPPWPQNMSLNSSTCKSSSSRLSKSATNQSLRSGFPSALTVPFKTPSPGESKPLMRVTPPLCSCGRRSRRRCVQNPGPNIGRWFYSCPINNSSSGGKCSGCTFFRWESPPSGIKLPR